MFTLGWVYSALSDVFFPFKEGLFHWLSGVLGVHITQRVGMFYSKSALVEGTHRTRLSKYSGGLCQKAKTAALSGASARSTTAVAKAFTQTELLKQESAVLTLQ